MRLTKDKAELREVEKNRHLLKQMLFILKMSGIPCLLNLFADVSTRHKTFIPNEKLPILTGNLASFPTSII